MIFYNSEILLHKIVFNVRNCENNNFSLLFVLEQSERNG